MARPHDKVPFQQEICVNGSDLLLAIDVGTQSARAIAFDRDGRQRARAQKIFEPTYQSPQPGWAEQDPDLYWRAVVECCQQLWAEG